MRGKTVKKIRKFVDILLLNTKEGEVTKTRDELIRDAKKNWRTKGEAGKKFVNLVVMGEFS